MKKWYQSKTIWLNIIASLLAMLGLFNQETLTTIGISTPQKFLAIIGMSTTFLNIVLRLLSTQSIDSFIGQLPQQPKPKLKDE